MNKQIIITSDSKPMLSTIQALHAQCVEDFKHRRVAELQSEKLWDSLKAVESWFEYLGLDVKKPLTKDE